jgi:indolepyruvate ferredoxin oxidoreductase alpha subunit
MIFTPLFDPATPREALEFTRLAFELSEHCRLPVILRPTTHLCHTRAEVRYGNIQEKRQAAFKRNPSKYVPIPVNARRMRGEIEGRLEKAREFLENRSVFCVEGKASKAVLTSGVPAATCRDLLEQECRESRVKLIQLPCVYPFPEKAIIEALEGVESVLVVEELSPFLEEQLAALCQREKLKLAICGKHSKHFPVPFEYGTDLVRKALNEALQLHLPPSDSLKGKVDLLPRPPILCAGCAHRSSYFAARAVFREEQLFFNDIGCYTLGYGEPLETADALLCMGAGISLADGVSRTTGQRTVAFIGDATFFHSGMPALLNAVKAEANIIVVILDNDVTAMTGFQESPTISLENKIPRRRVSIEKVVRALGAEAVETVDPYDFPRITGAFRRAREGHGVHVIIAERPCPVFMSRLRPEVRKKSFKIDASRCQSCGRKAEGFSCDLPRSLPQQRQMASVRIQETGHSGQAPAVSPCAEACPLHLCVQGYSTAIAAGRYADALKLIVEHLPLPESVCRVCERT